MEKFYLVILSFLLLSVNQKNVYGQETSGLIIDINATGFCSAEGVLDQSVAGYTGNGYINVNNALGVSVIWSVYAETSGLYEIRWRYAFGGTVNQRHGEIWVNEQTSGMVVEFEHTGAWTNWQFSPTFTVNLQQGKNTIRLTSRTQFGLPNLDYFNIVSENVTASECLPFYSLSVSSNDDNAGTFTVSPQQSYYEKGTEISLKASPGAGYFFHDWSGNDPSVEANYTFPISQHTVLTAMFYPEGTEKDPDITGYASIQDNKGTPFLLTGGSLGRTVEAKTLQELKAYLSSEEPLVVTIAGKIKGGGLETVNISSNKTLLGITDTAHIEGCELLIANAKNVILKNLIISYRRLGDLIEITHNSRNVWIDRCELFNDTEQDKDYYDELVAVKNGASFITISRSTFRDHQKGMLLSSGDQHAADSVIRITYHHNYFYNLGSRVPSLRFGKAHIFNNYYKECGDGINTRMGACIRVEKNYFEETKKALHNDYSPERGNFHFIDDNITINSEIQGTEFICTLDIPYDFELFISPTESLPEILPMKISNRKTPYFAEEEEEEKEEEENEEEEEGEEGEIITSIIRGKADERVSVYPNPTQGKFNISLCLDQTAPVNITVYDLTGSKVKEISMDTMNVGSHNFGLYISRPGMYIYDIRMGNQSVKGKIILE